MTSTQRPAPRRVSPTAAAALLTIALSACGGKSEAEQLAAMRDGLVYAQYRQVSENALPGGLAAYRKGLQWTGENWAGNRLPADLPKGDFSQADLCVTHVLLAYGALIADKRSIALAESDIVDAQQCGAFDRAAATSLRSVVFQREQWPELAQRESEKAWALPKQAGEDQPPVEHVIVMHAALAYFAASEQEWERAQVHFDALAQLLRQPWFAQLPPAGIAFKEGRTQDGLITLKKLSQDPSAPDAVRKELVALIAKIETKGGDVDSMIFMPRLVAVLGWEAIQAEGPQLLRTVTGFAEDKTWAAAGGSVKEGAGKAQVAAASWWNKAREAVSSPDEAPAPEPAAAKTDAGAPSQ
ncbi:hypothetical protein [Lysobacter sp. CA199]|uniref:hypothetical protein n=1 Tax=Lysobacter sp. CA199 TaxID=3455608 RepID=UPI003F8D4D0C